MVFLTSLSALGSAAALVGLSNAAALGTAQEYEDGTVHARIMGMKMVSILLYFLTPWAIGVVGANVMVRLSGMLNSLRGKWTARGIPSWATRRVRMASLLRYRATITIRSSAIMFVLPTCMTMLVS